MVQVQPKYAIAKKALRGAQPKARIVLRAKRKNVLLAGVRWDLKYPSTAVDGISTFAQAIDQHFRKLRHQHVRRVID